MKLKQEFDQCIEELGRELQAFPWEDKAAYAHWLGQTYGYVTHSTRLLALAASRFEDQQLHNRFLDHLREERGHEKMALHDLKNLGVAAETIPCFPETHAFYMTQYFYLEHTTPAAFFGWILALEGVAAKVGKDVYERVRSAHGEKAAIFLKVHAEEDISHVEKALEMVMGLPEAAHPKLIENMKNSAGLYAGSLRRCAATAKAKGTLKAA